MTTFSSTPHVSHARSITLRHAWLAGLGLASTSVRSVRNARDIAGTAVETFDYVQRRTGQRVALLSRTMFAKV